VILSGKLLSDSRLHESGKRGQDVDGRVDLPVVELTIDEDLALCDITSQIRDRMGDIWWSAGDHRKTSQLTIVGHGENRNLGDGTVSALDSTGSLVKSSQISVEVTGVTSSTGNFFSCSGNFSQSIGVTNLSNCEWD